MPTDFTEIFISTDDRPLKSKNKIKNKKSQTFTKIHFQHLNNKE